MALHTIYTEGQPQVFYWLSVLPYKAIEQDSVTKFITLKALQEVQWHPLETVAMVVCVFASIFHYLKHNKTRKTVKFTDWENTNCKVFLLA